MNRFLAAASMLALASCGGNLAPIAASLTPAVLPAEQLAKIQRACQLAGSALDVAAAANMPAQVRETAVYPKAYCDQLLAGMVPATTDANTPAWFDKTITILGIAAKAAGIILPLVL